jgi:hypothetical protein
MLYVCIWENKQTNLVTSCRLGLDLIQNFNWCRSMLNTNLTPDHVLTWEKPSSKWLKCNVDGAIFMLEEKFGIDICFRDILGSFVQTHELSLCSYYCCWMWSYRNETCSHARLVAFRELYSKVTVNKLWIFCLMIVCFLLHLTLCSQLAVLSTNYNKAYVKRHTNRVVHKMKCNNLYLFYYIKWNAMRSFWFKKYL